jgi:uncharacterized protein with beta-barrel porin domain
MKAFFSQKKKAILARTIVLGLCLMMPWNRAEAVSSYTTPNGMFRLDYYSTGESFTGKWYLENMREGSLERDKVYMTSQGNLPDWQKERINFAADYWDGLLKHTKTAKQPADLAVTVNNDLDNAVAEGSYTDVEINGQTVSVPTPNAVLNHGKVLTAEDGPSGFIVIGASLFPADGEQDRYDSPLFHGSQSGLASTSIHELGHALGLWTSDSPLTRFSEKANLYESHLYDWRGVQAQPGMEIRTLNHEAVTEPYFDLPDSYFSYDLAKGTWAYFSGRHVREVLDGAELCTYNYFGEKLDQKVPGLPVSGNEWVDGEDFVDLTHIELRNSMMSHQLWENHVSFMEAELAVLQDLGYTIDRRDFFGRSVYGDGLTIVNSNPYYARNADGTAYVAGAYNENPYGMGLHIYGNQNTVFQNAPLMTKGMGAVGIRVDGYGNNVTVNRGVNVQADGVNGNGILVAYGKDHNITLAEGSRVTAAGEGGIGAAFDFGKTVNGNEDGARASYAGKYWIYRLDADRLDVDGPLVKDFTVQGELSGKKEAIAISDNAFVKNIRVGTGAKLTGDIVSRWMYDDDKITKVIDGTETEDPLMQRQYVGDDELTTRLAFEGTGLAYDGNITGADNMRLFVSGDLVYGGTAQVLSAKVEKGGCLFGGTYSLIPEGAVQNALPAMGYTLPYTIMGSAKELQNVGLFTNHGTIGAASKDTTMKITGDLISDGTLQAYAGGTGGYIDVNGKADINGSEVKVANWGAALPGESIKVVKAADITGDTKTPVGTSYAVSGMMSATNKIKDNVLSVVTKAENNLGNLDETQSESFGAMTTMYNYLKNNNDLRVSEMRPLFSLSPSAAKEALSAISSNASAKSMAVAQRSMMTHHILSSRLNEAFMPKPVKVKLPSANLNDTAADGLDISLNLLEPAENDIWLKFGKNWGDLKDGADYHSSTTLLGYDKAVAPNWRVGAFASYSSTGFADSTAGNELKDNRFGLYAGYNKAGREAMVYLDYGVMRNKLRRGIPGMGLTADARYHSRILELGGEYLYDLHAAKNVSWHVRPYVNAQLSRLWQNGYSEEGAGVFNQVVQSKHNDYFGMGAGVEFKRYLPGGNYAIRAGVKHAFAGAEPKLRYSYMGDAANTYDMRNVQDKTHFVLSFGGETQIAKGWSIGGDASFTRGRHDKDLSCSVTVKRMW